MALPLFLATFAGLAWIVYVYSSSDASPPWYAWAMTVVAGVAGGVIHQLAVHRMPCPRCGAKNLEVSHGGRYVYLTCRRCAVRWNTGVRVEH